MKKNIFALSATALLMLASCSGDDNGNAVIHDPNCFFEPAAGADDPTSQLRREFQKKHGSYLLFNDTIQKEETGRDLNGATVYRTELLSLDYTIGQAAYASEAYTYTYLTAYSDQAAAVDFLEKRILPHLTKGMKPFSWFLCGQISCMSSSQKISHPYAASGQRAIAVGMSVLARCKTDAQKKNLCDRIMLVILQSLVGNNKGAFGSFFSVSEGRYGAALNAEGGNTARNTARKYGFLEEAADSWGNAIYPSQEQDLMQFCSYLVMYDDSYMEATFANFPLVLKKWSLFKDTLAELGYVIDING